MSTITHLKWPFHCDCKVVFSPGISSFTNQYLIAYPALFSCLLGKQLFPNHLWGNSFCFFWTKIRKRTQTLFSSKWGKYKHMTAKTLSHLLLKSQYFYQFNRASFIIFIISLIAMIKKKNLRENYLHSTFEATFKCSFSSATSQNLRLYHNIFWTWKKNTSIRYEAWSSTQHATLCY